MNWIEACILGVVQGLTEFIPISSSAHLRVVPALLGWSNPGAAYSAVIQLGSMLAVITYFAHDLLNIIKGSIKAVQTKDFTSYEFRLATAIIIGTIPICIIGLIFKKLIVQHDGPFRSLITIGLAAIIMGCFLFAAEKLGKRKRGIESIAGRDGFLVGLGQALALIPGCSRSGSTLTVSLLLNMKREDAARFSFLLGMPAITLAGLLELKDMLEMHIGQVDITNLIIGFIVSTIVSYASIAWLLKYLKEHSTIVFIIYRIIFGLAIIMLSINGFIR